MGLHDEDDLGMEDGDALDDMEGSYMGNDEMGESKCSILMHIFSVSTYIHIFLHFLAYCALGGLLQVGNVI